MPTFKVKVTCGEHNGQYNKVLCNRHPIGCAPQSKMLACKQLKMTRPVLYRFQDGDPGGVERSNVLDYQLWIGRSGVPIFEQPSLIKLMDTGQLYKKQKMRTKRSE